jgi:chromosome segregation ATPase
VETKRIEREIEMCYDELYAEKDIEEDEEYWEERRSELHLEIRMLEVEFAHYAKCFASRAHERKECKVTIDRLGENRRELLVRKNKIEKEVNELRQLVPPAVATVLGIEAAARSALDLNTSFTPVTTSHKSK